MKDFHTVKELAYIFAVGYNTMINCIHDHRLEAKNISKDAYVPKLRVTQTSLTKFLRNNPKWVVLLQQNPKRDADGNEILHYFQQLYPELCPAYSYNDVIRLLQKGRGWYAKHVTAGRFSASYIFQTELLNFLRTHPKHVAFMKERRNSDKRLEVMRVRLLTLLEEGEQE